MRDRFITWGTLDDQRRLFTFELEADDAEIIRRVLPARPSSEALRQTIINAWVQRTTMNYPEGTLTERIPFASFGSIVPDGADVEDKVRVASAEREWPFDLISGQLRRQFTGELEEFREKVEVLEKFDDGVYERLKAISDKIKAELDNKTLRGHDFAKLKDLTDGLFGVMKRLRRGERKKLDQASRGVKQEFLTELTAVQAQLEEKTDPRKLFKDLRGIQDRVKAAKMRGSDRNALRKRLDQLFKAVKAEMDASGATVSALSQKRAHLENRLKGLKGAISRMRYSVDRDNKDMFYEGRRRERANNQLAEQLAALKLTTIGDRAQSKASRLDDMLATEAELEQKLAKLIKAEEKAAAKRAAAAERAAQSSPPAGPPAAGKKRKGRRAVHPRLVDDVVAGVLASARALGQAAPAAPPNADAGKTYEPRTEQHQPRAKKSRRERGKDHKRGAQPEVRSAASTSTDGATDAPTSKASLGPSRKPLRKSRQKARTRVIGRRGR